MLEYDTIEEHLGLKQRSWVLLVSRNKGGTPVKEVTLDKRERYARTNQNVGGKSFKNCCDSRSVLLGSLSHSLSVEWMSCSVFKAQSQS